MIATLIIPNQEKLSLDTDKKLDTPDSFKYCTEISVRGRSIEPTLKEGQRICAYQEKPAINDLVVFKCKNCPIKNEAVKRLKKIENECYWVLGDNNENSLDSREFGFLCKDNLEYIWKVEKIEK